MWKSSSKSRTNQNLAQYFGLAWVGFSIFFVGLLYMETFLSLHRKWIAFDESYSHGYLVLLFSIYWLILHLHKTTAYFGPRWWAVPLALGASFIWYFGWSTQMVVLEQLALPFVLYALLLSVFGWRTLKPIVIPLLFLLLTLPIWDIAVPVLRLMTTKVVQFWISFSGIPAFVSGYMIELPYGTLRVAGGCSGLNFFMVGVVLGAFYAHQNARGLIEWLVCLGTALLFSIVGNWIRVYSLVLIAYHSNMRSEIVYNHGTFGWIIFSIVLVFYFLFIRWLSKYLSPAKRETNEKPEEVQFSVRESQSSGIAIRVAIPVCVIAILLIGPAKTAMNKASTTEMRSSGGLVNQSSWKKIDLPKFSPKFNYWDTAEHWKFSEAVELEYSQYVYFSQEQGKEMVYYSNIIADENATLLEGELNLKDLPRLNYLILKGDYSNQLILWVYKVGEVYSSSNLQAKLLQFPQSLLGNTQTALQLVSIDCRKSECDNMLENIGRDNSLINTLKAVWPDSDQK